MPEELQQLVVHESMDICHWGSIEEEPPLIGYKNKVNEVSEKCERLASSAALQIRGDDYNDVPTEYTVPCVYEHEKVVIGTFIDPAIMPGFRYRVRIMPTSASEIVEDRYQFNGEPKYLQSISYGYGKRITFDKNPNQKNFEANGNYFYSDTFGCGCGFTICPVVVGDTFTLYSDELAAPIGAVRVTSIAFPQHELSSRCCRDSGLVEKQVRVTFQCAVTLNGDNHGIVYLRRIEHEVVLSGYAELSKGRRDRRPVLSGIWDVDLQSQGIPGRCCLVTGTQ